MRDWNNAVLCVARKLSDPVVVGACVRGRELIVSHVPQDPNRGKQNSGAHAPFVEHFHPFFGQVAGWRASVEVYHLSGHEQTLTGQVGATQAGQYTLEQWLIVDGQNFEAIRRISRNPDGA